MAFLRAAHNIEKPTTERKAIVQNIKREQVVIDCPTMRILQKDRPCKLQTPTKTANVKALFGMLDKDVESTECSESYTATLRRATAYLATSN